MKQLLLLFVLNFVVFLELIDVHRLLQELGAQLDWQDEFVALIGLFPDFIDFFLVSSSER